MEPFNEQPQQTEQNPISTEPVGFPGNIETPKKKSKMWVIVLVLFVVAIAVITFIVFKGSRQTNSDTENLSPSTLPTDASLATPEVTATPESTSKNSLKIQVLNGTGVAGEAALLQTKLKNLGYANVDTGNATQTGVTKTSVAFGSSVSQDVVTEITNLLKQTYTSVETNSTISGNFDIQVTVGGRIGASTPVAASASPTASPAVQ